jgi:hypothetical protein
MIVAGAVYAQTPAVSHVDSALAAVRTYARTYTEKLPNYTATQIIRRRVKTLARGPMVAAGTQVDNIEEQIGWVGGRETHKILKANGRLMGDESPVRDQGIFSTGEFGGLLAGLFRDEASARFDFVKSERLDGRKVDMFAFRVAAQPAGYAIVEPGRTVVVGYEGRLRADAETHAVTRIELHCVDFPIGVPYKALELTLDYARAKVGGTEYILPARYRLHTRSEDAEIEIDATYRGYQKFAVESSIIE